jgi:hypothetical protein
VKDARTSSLPITSACHSTPSTPSLLLTSARPHIMEKKCHYDTPPGPSTRLKTSPKNGPTTADIEPMVVGSESSVAASTGRHFADDAMTFIASILGTISQGWDDTSDTALISHLGTMHDIVRVSMSSHPSLVSFDQCINNATKMGASGFTDLLRKALRTKELSLWLPVVTHGASS